MDKKNLSRLLLWRTPVVYKSLMKKKWGSAFEPSCFDCYVCGFPRSGNNFLRQLLSTVTDLESSQISGASHLPPLIEESIELGLPTFLTIRNPVDSAASWVTATDCSIEHALDYYYLFHQRIQTFDLSKVLLCSFDEMVKLEGAFRDKFYQYAEKHFSCGAWPHPEQVLEALKSNNGPRDSMMQTAPSDKKRAKNSRIKARFDEQKYQVKIERANSVYHELNA